MDQEELEAYFRSFTSISRGTMPVASMLSSNRSSTHLRETRQGLRGGRVILVWSMSFMFPAKENSSFNIMLCYTSTRNVLRNHQGDCLPI
jgi:hypothetical protein